MSECWGAVGSQALGTVGGGVCLSECWGVVGSQAMGTGPWALGPGHGARGPGPWARGTGHGARGTGHGARGTGHGARGTGHGVRGTGHGAVYVAISQRGSDSRSSRDLYTCKDWCEREPEGHNYNCMVQKPSD